MRVEALKHLATSAAALAADATIVVFGSASAFATYPELGVESDLYQQTKDADFIFEPWEQRLGKALNSAVGKESLFYDHFGYYADIISPAAFDNFPPDFRDRLVPLEGCPRVFALDPHDMAVAKLFAGRPKDIRLLAFLLATTFSTSLRSASCCGTRRWRKSGSSAPTTCWIRRWRWLANSSHHSELTERRQPATATLVPCRVPHSVAESRRRCDCETRCP